MRDAIAGDPAAIPEMDSDTPSDHRPIDDDRSTIPGIRATIPDDPHTIVAEPRRIALRESARDSHAL